jgi:hypothetical protein
MKYLQLIALTLISYSSVSQIYTDTSGVFGMLSHMQPKFLRIEQVKGVAYYPVASKNWAIMVVAQNAIRYDSVFQDLRNANHTTLAYSAWETYEYRVTFRIKTPKRDLDLKKNYTFIPYSEMQD